ncbi:MAG: NAD(P)-dependent alcohol dehydrogenase [Gammaproteobacteria bacterium]|nr:NAD(P)-dependent alcohol dehydrogenase [Gammaproteobacteria bacterium]
MKAIVYTKYGSPDVLQLKEVEKPTPRDNEVLVKVHAASVNSWDWDLLRGTPFVNRLAFGILKPKIILGCDIAGRVEAVGNNVKQFQPGDEVFGDLSRCGWGGFAEYVCARENALAPKPVCLTFEQAAAVPQAGLLALQALRDKGQIQPGQRVLMNGAGGGVGSFAIPMAKSFGAEVTGVDSTNKMDFVCSLGADHVIDYTQEDFTNNGQSYNLIIDVAGYRSIFDYKRALSAGGRYVMVGGSDTLFWQLMFLGPWISMTSGKKMGLLLHKANKGIDFMIELFEAGKVVPVIDRLYPLSKVAEALRYFGEGSIQGKIIITFN